MVMETIDLKKQLNYLYAPSARKVEVVEVPEFQFAMVDGALQPGEMPGTSPQFQEATGALYGVAYTLKFASKLRKENPVDYPVMALEGLWWVEGGAFDLNRPDAWRWTLMILQPDHVTQVMFQDALKQLEKKRPSPALARLRLERSHEGLCLQVMHVRPYADEPQTIQRMQAYARENGYAYCGKHHEIYLGDPRRSAPEKLRTVLRQPIRKAP
jgi:hypothetical protein